MIPVVKLWPTFHRQGTKNHQNTTVYNVLYTQQKTLTTVWRFDLTTIIVYQQKVTLVK